MSNPSILWAQDREKIFVTLDILNLSSQNISFDSKQIKFVGKNNSEDFDFEIDLHANIIVDSAEWQVKSTGVKIILEKEKRKFWNRLTLNKQNNVKIDWQKWVNESDSEESDENESLIQNFNDFKKTLPSELLETDFKELLPQDDLGDLDELDELNEEDSLVNNSNQESGELPIDDLNTEIDDGFLANGEESYTDNSLETVQIDESNGNLEVNELDVEKLDNDLEEDLDN